mgnify:CR=1 FL=1
MGFSVNNLTLMALTISTGFVVDDAIVMIENIVRYIEEGESPLQAALKGSAEYRAAIPLILLIVIILVRPQGLLGKAEGRTV